MQQIDASGDTFGDLSGLDFRGADLMGVNVYGGFTGANLTGADLSQAHVQGLIGSFANAVLRRTNSFGADVGGLSFEDSRLSLSTTFLRAEIQFANFTGTRLVPADRSVSASPSSGTVVKWRARPALPGATSERVPPRKGATPKGCRPASGSLLPVGVKTVRCTIKGDPGLPNIGGPNTASGTFTVTVH